MEKENRKKENAPSVHFAPAYGWMNDPNGLVYHDGMYELYYQHNPLGIDWNCMTWGHARGTDLLHWEDLGDVLKPDENGLMFSGCAIRNDHELLGLPKDALIYFYTAAGHYSEESGGKPYTIRLACSTDGGRTIVKRGGPVLETLASENRDPKVFWHEKTGAYVLVLWIEGNEFGIWRSENLESFTLTQRLTLRGGNECPDLFELPVANTEGETRWVFWSADGFYYVGEFDGYEFRQEQERRCAYAKGPDGVLPYAAQTWSGLDKTLSVSWLRTKCVDKKTTGLMSVPKEFSLLWKPEGLVLQQSFPDSVKKAFQTAPGGAYEGAVYGRFRNRRPSPFLNETEKIGLHSEEMEWRIDLCSAEKTLLTVECQKETKKLFFTHGIVTDLCDAGCELEDLELLYDHGVLELLGNQGTFYLAVDFPELRGEDAETIEFSDILEGMEASF